MKTKWGNATINKHSGYYVITSSKEGNNGKKLHRLIMEEYLGCEIPKGYLVHHVDENKLNNDIDNLVLVKKVEHSEIHRDVFSFEGRRHTEKTKNLIGLKSKEMWKDKSKIGLFRVHIHQDDRCKQGFDYCYQYPKNSKQCRISSVNILKLRDKVLAKGLEWFVVDEDKVKSNFDSVTADKLCEAIQ